MSAPEELAIKVTISEQKAKYCRYLDSKQFDEWEALFKRDAAIVFYNPDGSVLGKFDSIAELAPLARKVFGTRSTAHQIHNAEITITSETSATAIWSLADFQVHPATASEPAKAEHGFGFFHETWERVDQIWLIASLQLQRMIEWHA